MFSHYQVFEIKLFFGFSNQIRNISIFSGYKTFNIFLEFFNQLKIKPNYAIILKISILLDFLLNLYFILFSIKDGKLKTKVKLYDIIVIN